ALRGTGVVLVFLDTSNGSTQLDLATAGPDGVWTNTVIARGAQISSPSVAVSGGRTVVGWVVDGRAWLMIDDGDLHFSGGRPVPYRAPVNALRVAASGGRAFVATSSCFPYAASTTCRVYLAEAGLTGPVTGTEVSVGTGAIRWELEDLVAARGRATVLMDTGKALVSRSQNG
ncbi:MAG: hypothetical protein QOE05_3194, partial [Actinomycetota bacterium]|nr:hypothetical protein [Actinomycetota bacterium]